MGSYLDYLYLTPKSFLPLLFTGVSSYSKTRDANCHTGVAGVFVKGLWSYFDYIYLDAEITQVTLFFSSASKTRYAKVFTGVMGVSVKSVWSYLD